MNNNSPDFTAAHAVLQRAIDSRFLPGACATTLLNGEQIDSFCAGYADIENQMALRTDHIHRANSTTKLITSVLALLLADEGHYGLDDPVKAWIPSLGRVRVLNKAATSLEDTQALEHDITIRHLLSHQAGFSHGVFDPGTMIYKAYHAAGLRRPDTTLAEMTEVLASLPLLFQPGQGWEYSMATDVLARLIEVVTGQTFDEALQTRVFDPVGMKDTGFVLRPDQVPRFAALYIGDLLDPLKPGITRLDDVPWPGAFLHPVPRQSGAGGLFTTQADVLALLPHLLPGRSTLLQPATIAEMMRDQLPAQHHVHFMHLGPFPSLGFGLGGAVTRTPSDMQPNSPAGEFQWGGLAGTHWWISPSTGIAGVLMTQRQWGFWNPFWFEYKRQVYAATG